jgi:hypothetical protein
VQTTAIRSAVLQGTTYRAQCAAVCGWVGRLHGSTSLCPLYLPYLEQDIRSSLPSDVLAARAECAPLANATSVVCTGPTDSRATACEAGFYLSEADTCQGAWLEVPCLADRDP